MDVSWFIFFLLLDILFPDFLVLKIIMHWTALIFVIIQQLLSEH